MPGSSDSLGTASVLLIPSTSTGNSCGSTAYEYANPVEGTMFQRPSDSRISVVNGLPSPNVPGDSARVLSPFAQTTGAPPTV